MKYYCNPMNLPYRYQMVDHTRAGAAKEPLHIYREAADPSLILFKGKYYMFPSMTAGFFTSDDLTDWKFHEFLSEMPVYDYAPDVREMGEYLYFCASRRGKNCSFYRTKEPLTEPFEEIEGTFEFWDPNLFQDEDGRVYFYWGCSNVTPIYGVELNPETMKPKTEPLVMFDSNRDNQGYERIGNDHINPKKKEEIEAQAEAMISKIMQMPKELRKQNGMEDGEYVRQMAYSIFGDAPYIEGAWMTKHNGKYYLQYAIPGTQFNVYGDGVYVADQPLGPYTLAMNNPYSYKPGGFMNGAGHGSTVQDKNGSWHHVSTMSISCNDDMERRLGLWKAGFDADGELYCDQRYGDWPIRIDAPAFSEPDWMLLSYGKPVTASSGEGIAHVTDENCRTWWRAEHSSQREWVMVDLGQNQDIRAIQVNFMDSGICAEIPKSSDAQTTYETRYIDRTPHATRWLLEGSCDKETWDILADKREVRTDLAHDFLVWEKGICYRYLRLTVVEMPYGQPACVSALRVFGNGRGALPKQTENVTADFCSDLDMRVSWEQDQAAGHNILWGYAPEKLYHSYMVFGKAEQNIGALVKGQAVYLRVDSFNENGITEGQIMKVRDGYETNRF